MELSSRFRPWVGKYGDFGLYTIVEVVDNTVLESQFVNDSGNLYKPDGQGAGFAAGSYDTAHFPKDTNADAADWSDVRAMYDALHAANRTSDPSDGGRLTWIPWDNKEALKAGKMGGARSIPLAEVTNAWPLIRYHVDDATYRRRYASFVEATVAGPFEPGRMSARYQQVRGLSMKRRRRVFFFSMNTFCSA